MSEMPEDLVLRLLRYYEPEVRYNQGESFLPMSVEAYIRECSLWVQHPGREPELLVPQGELTLDVLAQPRQAAFGAVHFLRYIEPLNLADLAAHRLREGFVRREFRAGRGRLARVGFGSRLLDALFEVTLFARGRVPGDTAAAAVLAYQQLMAGDPHHTYYGRVVEQNGWVVLQYWFFYAFNNWRSGFFGANDHEADWEMVCVYLAPVSSDPGSTPDPANPRPDLRPLWVAYASHDFSGDDLRRHWDDPKWHKNGSHPVIYAGAGSHASYFRPGDYLAELELPFLRPLVDLTDRLQTSWAKLLRRYQLKEEHELEQTHLNVFRVPFVDYARGDGVVIGSAMASGSAETRFLHSKPQRILWSEPELLQPEPGWVLHYRGLFGLYARDPLSGEDAPAGPRYNRDGSVRRAWYDPLGWAGLDKVPPPAEAVQRLLARREALLDEQARLAADIAARSEAIVTLGVELAAMESQPHLQTRGRLERQRLDEAIQATDRLRATYAENEALLDALRQHADLVKTGQQDPRSLRKHIRRAHQPSSPLGLSRFAEGWAAISTGLFLIIFVLLFLLARDSLDVGLGALLLLLLTIEAAFRRRLEKLIVTATGILAFLAALVIIYEYFWELTLLGVLLLGGFLIFDNLREFWS